MTSAGWLLVLALAGCKSKPAAHHDAASRPIDAVVIDAALPIDAAVKAAREEHAVWSFVDNRHLAHRAVDGELVIDARGVDFARYTRFSLARWRLGVTIGSERAAELDRFANLEVPIIPEQAAPTQITMHVSVTEKGRVEVRANGRKVGRVALEPGWQTVAVTFPRELLHAGENVVALSAPRKLAMQWMRVGASHPPGDQDPLAATTFDATGDAIELAEHASLTWYVTIPEGANVLGEVASPCAVEVGARAADASYAGGLLGGADTRVDLSAMSGKTVRLSLTARDCPRARLVHPRITIHGRGDAALPTADPARYVVLWHVATLQGDPDLDALARASVVFRQFLWSEPEKPLFDATIRGTVGDVLTYIDTHRDKPFAMYADTSSSPPAELGRVMAQLKSWGIWEQTLLLVATPDVLIAHDPARFPPGTLVDEGCDGSDLVPTIEDARGKAATGLSLVPLARGKGRGWPRPSYVSDSESHTMRIGNYMLTVTAAGQVTSQLGPIERRMLTDALGLYLSLRSQWNKATWGVVTNLSMDGAHALDEAAAP